MQFTLMQAVGDSTSLAGYRSKHSTRTWRTDEDELVDGRIVGVASKPALGDCMTYVQLDEASIQTFVIHQRLPHPPIDQICEKALEFTRATIGKMPR